VIMKITNHIECVSRHIYVCVGGGGEVLWCDCADRKAH
jgi:hypothetical protein